MEEAPIGPIQADIDRFNAAAEALQTTEFRRSRTRSEWQRMHDNPPVRDYQKLFTPVTRLIESFVALSPAERASVAPRLTEDGRGILRTFADRAAVVAVRVQSPELLKQSLIALAILCDADDPRDLSFYLAPSHYCAMKLGLDTTCVFSGAAAFCSSSQMGEWMRKCIQTYPRHPSAAYIREVTTVEGFELERLPFETERRSGAWKWIRKFFLGALLGSLLPAFGDCRRLPAAQAFNAAESVFRGKVTQLVRVHGQIYIIRLKVLKQWKGKPEGEKIVVGRFAQPYPAESYVLSVGMEYILYPLPAIDAHSSNPWKALPNLGATCPSPIVFMPNELVRESSELDSLAAKNKK